MSLTFSGVVKSEFLVILHRNLPEMSLSDHWFILSSSSFACSSTSIMAYSLPLSVAHSMPMVCGHLASESAMRLAIV